MSNTAIRQIDRTLPTPAVVMMAILFYGFAVPVNWICARLGLRTALISMMAGRRSTKRWEKAFQGYEPTAHDVIVSTFAKSGTNWMMQIAHQIAFRGAGDYENIHDVVSWPDMNTGRGRKMSVTLDDTTVQQASPTGLRVIKTHLSASYVPYNDKARYVIVVRDPKEVFVSSYFFAAGPAGPLMPNAEDWFDLYISNRFPLGFGSTWAEHTAGYWALRNEPNVRVLSFRAMKQDLQTAVRQVADLMGVQLTSSEMSEVVTRSSFSYMKNTEGKFALIARNALPWTDGYTMMRRGETGKSQELLTLDQQAQIDAHFQKQLERLGSDFPYRTFFDVGSTSHSGMVA